LLEVRLHEWYILSINEVVGLTHRAGVHRLPTISTFFGVFIRMYFDDHQPAHFHAYYAGAEATYEIATLGVLAGSLPNRANALVLEWAVAHRDELTQNWLLAQAHQPLNPIKPLE